MLTWTFCSLTRLVVWTWVICWWMMYVPLPAPSSFLFLFCFPEEARKAVMSDVAHLMRLSMLCVLLLNRWVITYMSQMNPIPYPQRDVASE